MKIYEYPKEMLELDAVNYKPRRYIIGTEIDTKEERVFSSSRLYSYVSDHMYEGTECLSGGTVYFAFCVLCEQSYRFDGAKIVTDIDDKPIVLCNNCINKHTREKE